jgi:hypothetical protein
MNKMNRYKPVGWRNEPHRHYLAAKGISTSLRKQNKNFVEAARKNGYDLFFANREGKVVIGFNQKEIKNKCGPNVEAVRIPDKVTRLTSKNEYKYMAAK